MNTTGSIKIALVMVVSFFVQHAYAQNPVNWTKEQLLQPAELAAQLTSDRKPPAIFSIGPGALIPQSVNIGSVSDQANLEKFRQQVKSLPKDAEIVVYCGCCPFEHCPNARPAIQVLKDMKFTNYKLLNLEHNLKVDWLDKGYPAAKL